MKKELTLNMVSECLTIIYGIKEGEVAQRREDFLQFSDEKNRWLPSVRYSIGWSTDHMKNTIIFRIHCDTQEEFDAVEEELHNILSKFKGKIVILREHEEI